MQDSRFISSAIKKFGQIPKADQVKLVSQLYKDRQLLLATLSHIEDAVIFLHQGALSPLNAWGEKLLRDEPQLESTLLGQPVQKSITLYLSHSKRYVQMDGTALPAFQTTLFVIRDTHQVRQTQVEQKQEASLRSLSNLAAGIAHEIKNPLSAIDFQTQALQRGIKHQDIPSCTEIDTYLDIVRSEIRRLSQIVEEFLLSAREHRLTLRFMHVDEVIQEVLSLFQAELDARHIRTQVHCEASIQLFIDKDYLKQALMNLVRNAMDAIPKDSLHGEIRLESYFDNSLQKVILLVQDNGIGMSSETLSQLFDPYFSTKSRGTGLGLTIVYKVIRDHGGEIQVDSHTDTLKHGTCFTITLPLRKEETLLLSRDAAAPLPPDTDTLDP